MKRDVFFLRLEIDEGSAVGQSSPFQQEGGERLVLPLPPITVFARGLLKEKGSKRKRKRRRDESWLPVSPHFRLTVRKENEGGTGLIGLIWIRPWEHRGTIRYHRPF